MAASRKPLPESLLANSFAVRLADLCAAKFPGERQTQLARRFQVSQPMISAYMAGLKLPSTAQMLNMCRVLGCSLDYLMLGNERPPDDKSLDMSNLSDEHRRILADMKAALEKSPKPEH